MQKQKRFSAGLDSWLVKNGLYHHTYSGNLVPIVPPAKKIEALAETFGTDEKTVIAETVKYVR